MKNGFFIFFAAFIYTYLLFNQGIGINILILTLLLVPSLFIFYPKHLKNKLSLLFAAGAFISAVFAFINGHVITIITNICSLALLSTSLHLKQKSILSSLIHILYSYFSSIIQVGRYFIRKYSNENEQNGQLRKRIVIYLSSLLVFALFITLYQASNVTFYHFIQQINLDFISIPSLFFYATAYIILYAFFRPRIIAELAIYEKHLPLYIHLNTSYKSYQFLGNKVEEDTELKTGIIMLGLLNGLLLLVNTLDLQFMFGGQLLPSNISYASYVHQGIFSLILSTLIAIVIILWYFRGTQNFSTTKTLKLLAYAWIIQNVIMLLSAAYKNNLYINEYSLTYKRIGVYVFLICTLTGLLFTFIKLLHKRSNFYIVKLNSLCWYIILVLAVPISWDKMIAEFNIGQANSKGKAVDIAYLYSLSYQAYPSIIKYQIEHQTLLINPFNTEYPPALSNLAKQEFNYTWQSYNLARCNGYDEIYNLLNKGTSNNDNTAYPLFQIFSTYRNLFN